MVLKNWFNHLNISKFIEDMHTCYINHGNNKSFYFLFLPHNFRSTKNFQKKYFLELTAATFLIIDYNEESMEIACEWQKCIGDTINLVSPLRCA